MDANYGSNAISFLLNTLVDLYVTIVALRFLMQMVRADYYNPIAQFVVKTTNPLLVPLRRIIPGFAGQDIAALVLCWLLLLAKLYLFTLMGVSSVSIAGYLIMMHQLPLLSLMVLALIDLLGLFFSIYIFAIIIQAILSWVSPGNYNPLAALLYQITAPLLTPVQKLIPPISGIDLSPLVLLIGLQLLKMLVLPQLFALA